MRWTRVRRMRSSRRYWTPQGEHHARTGHDVGDEGPSWYMRHLEIVEGGMTVAEFTLQQETVKALELGETSGGCMLSIFGDSEW